jgi:alkylated DNA repair dioxygenase AlkB
MHKYIKDTVTIKPDFDHWDEPNTREYGGVQVVGRPTRGFGDSPFEYAGKHMNPEPWDTENMEFYKDIAEDLATHAMNRKIKFTFCLCGLYKSGQVSIPHHTDTVPTLDDIVLSFSFGAPRVFEWNEYGYDIKKESNTSETLEHRLKIWEDKPIQTTRYLLSHGDALIFDGHSQMRSTHAVPKLENVGERINLTFRSGL